MTREINIHVTSYAGLTHWALVKSYWFDTFPDETAVRTVDVSDTTAFRDVVLHRGYGGSSFFPRGKESAKKQSEGSDPQYNPTNQPDRVGE